MTDKIYRRSRFSEATLYEYALAPVVEEVAPLSWVEAAQAYEVTTQVEGNREAVQSLLEEARWILNLGDDWDGEGAVGYEKSTLDRAEKVLCEIVDCCWDYLGAALPRLTVNPADDGSIDLSWRQAVRLLINVPPKADVPCTFAALGPSIELYGSVTRRTLPTLVDLMRNGG